MTGTIKAFIKYMETIFYIVNGVKDFQKKIIFIKYESAIKI